jgi:N-methylhydantoinase A
VYKRDQLGAGATFSGPCVVEERETTAVIRPGWNVEVGPDGSLIATNTHA